MSYRDDFSSNMNSPGNYSRGGNYGKSGYSGNYGGTNNPGAGYQTPAQARWAAQGGHFGKGSQFGKAPNRGGLLGYMGVGLPDPNANIIPKGVFNGIRINPPAPTSLPPPVTQEDIPGVVQPEPAPQGIPWQPQRYVNPGFGMDPNGIGRTVTPRTAPRGYFGPSQPTYSRDGQGYVSNAGPYGGATYARMGSDFRSIDNW